MFYRLPLSLSLVLLTRSAMAQTPVRNIIETPPRTPPTCQTAELSATYANNAKDVAAALNGITEGISVKALGRRQLLICGDNSNGAVRTVREAAVTMGKEQSEQMASREAPMVRLFFNRDAATVVSILNKAFPKLGAYASGTDTLVLGAPDGSDAEDVQTAKRWIAALDQPRSEVTLNVWSAQVSGKSEETVQHAGTRVKQIVTEHNRELEMALERTHRALRDMHARLGEDYFAPYFSRYLRSRYVVSDDPTMPLPSQYVNACGPRDGAANKNARREYCLGFEKIFWPHPNLSSFLINVIAAKSPRSAALEVINALENRNPAGPASLFATGVRTKGYAQNEPPTTSHELSLIYGVAGTGTPRVSNDCEVVADAAYALNPPPPGPLFPCLREALSDATAPLALANLRMAIADFLKHYKFSKQYPDAVEPENDVIHHMDSLALPLMSAFNRDMTGYLRYVRTKVTHQSDPRERGVDFGGNGIITLAGISSIPSSVTTSTQNAFRLPPSFSLKDFLAASAPGKDNAALDNVPAFLAKNLVGGVALPLLAGLSAENAPAVATLGKGLTMSVVPQSLPGGSAAELNVNLMCIADLSRSPT